MKICSLCKRGLEVSSFYPHKRNKSGFSSWCIECASKKAKQAYQKRKDKVKEQTKQWKLDNEERAAEILREYYKRNKKKIATRNSEWKQNNRSKVTAHSRKRYANKLRRSPNWLTEFDLEFMKEVYALAELRTRLTGIEWQVDHICPLQGKLVSGLHVPNNLQVVPAAWNQSKNNRFNIDKFSSNFYWHIYENK